MKTTSDTSPILLIPHMWIGDFVRAHSVVKLLNQRWPRRPVDVLTTKLCAPLLDYMPGVRQGIISDLPRSRIALSTQRALAARMRNEGYGTAILLPRTWKSALAPFLAGIPERVGFIGELRLGLINDLRFGEYSLPRMIDRCGALALPKGAKLPADWPLPELRVPEKEVSAFRANAASQRVVALGPAAVGPGKAWPAKHFQELARRVSETGLDVWVIGGPADAALVAEVAGAAGERGRALISPDLRQGILALRAADVAVTNDSGLMHIAAALGTPTVAIFGPTSPYHWRPLNPLAAIIEPPGEYADVRQRRTADISPDRVFEAVQKVIRA